MAGSGWAGRAAGRRRRSHRGRCRAEGGVGGGEAGSQGADGGHGGHCCAAETGDGLRQLAGHLAERKRDRFRFLELQKAFQLFIKIHTVSEQIAPSIPEM